MPATLIELSPYDPVTSAVVPVRATTDDDNRVCALNGVPWFPVLMKAGSFGLDLFDAGFPGFASTPTARVELDLSAFPDAARYSWGDRPVRLWTGEPGTAWPWAQLFEGLVQAATVRDGRLTLTLRVNDAWLDRPVLNSYAGTGAVEGPAALQGAPKPLALGAPKYVAPQLIDAVNNVWQFHGAGSARAVTAALDRLVRYPSSVGNSADFAALVAASIPPGSFGTCLALGLVRFGAPPAGPLTLIVEGDNGSAAGWVRRPGALIRRIALLAGATTAQLDLANLTALDTAAPFNLSLYVTAQTTARDLIARVAASVNGLAMVNLLGQLQVILPAIGTPALTLAADGSAEPQVTSLELLETGAPWWRTQLSGDTCWRPHQPGEFYEPPQGDPGPPGANTAQVLIYQRAASAPAAPSATATYTFSSGTIAGLTGGWSAAVPTANGQPLWVRQALATGTGATDTISAGEWGAASIIAEDGADGADGESTKPIYRRSATVPATPAASSGVPAGWFGTSAAVPSGAEPMWISIGQRPNATANYTWDTATRHEAISAVNTGASTPLGFATSAVLTFSLAPGESRVVRGQLALEVPTGAGDAFVQLESRQSGGGWTATNGTSQPYAVGEPAFPTHQITVTNSTGRLATFEARGTGNRSNSNSGPTTAGTSIVSV